MKSLTMLILVCLSFEVYSQGYCSLRDPQAKIKSFFPEFINFKTIVSTVDDNARKKLTKMIPFKLYHYDIGRHSIYSINSEKGPRGIVHARSEQSNYGLVEIAWALNYDLSILDFGFQRCRTSKKSIIQDPKFRSLIIGKNFYQLCRYIDSRGKLLDSFNIKAEDKEFAQIIIQSAIKTIALTQISWREVIEEIKNTKKADVNLVKYIKETDLFKEARFYSKDETWIKARLKKEPNLELEVRILDGQIKELYVPINEKLKGLDMDILKKEIDKLKIKFIE